MPSGEAQEVVVDSLVEEKRVGSDRFIDGELPRSQYTLASVLRHEAGAGHLQTEEDGGLLVLPGQAFRATDRDRGRPCRTDSERSDRAEADTNGQVLSGRTVIDVDRHHGFPHGVADHFLAVARRYERRVQNRAHEPDLRLRRSYSRPDRDSARSFTSALPDKDSSRRQLVRTRSRCATARHGVSE